MLIPAIDLSRVMVADLASDWVGVLFSMSSLLVPLVLLMAGIFIGGAIERAHFRRLDAAEAELSDMLLTDLRQIPPGMQPKSATLVSGSVVIGSDYFKNIAAALRNLVGGEVRSFDRLMQRARREATCRLLAHARSLNARAVINVRFETSNISAANSRKKTNAMVEVIAYGTALVE